MTLEELRSEVQDLVYIYETYDGFDIVTAVGEAIAEYILDVGIEFRDFDFVQFLSVTESDLWELDQPRDNALKK